jgi:dTDP-4-dehydrorhamnose 3,5-epimerase-like enzyme
MEDMEKKNFEGEIRVLFWTCSQSSPTFRDWIEEVMSAKETETERS